VDLTRRFITVRTAKTGQTVDIPIFPRLFDELSRAEKLKFGKQKAEIASHLTPALSPPAFV